MIGFSIESIGALIVGLCAVLTVFTVYMIVERTLEDRRKRLERAYLIRNRVGWYEYIRSDGMPKDVLIPKNEAEVNAVEELFRALVHNVKGEGMEKRISEFANRHLAKGYRKKLQGRNWGERINTLYRIHDFGMDSLADECRKLAKRTNSSEEHFLLLLIELKFNPVAFLDRNSDKLNAISANDAKELFFGMPDEVFREAVVRMETLDRKVQLSIVDVIGMKLELSYIPLLEKFLSHTDSEMRIRVLKAYNSLTVLPSLSVLNSSAESGIWQERYQVARLLSLLPKKDFLLIAKKLENDKEFLIQEKVSSSEEALYETKAAYNEAATDTHIRTTIQKDILFTDDRVGQQETKLFGRKGDE